MRKRYGTQQAVNAKFEIMTAMSPRLLGNRCKINLQMTNGLLHLLAKMVRYSFGTHDQPTASPSVQ
jgi:hypothetical protein